MSTRRSEADPATLKLPFSTPRGGRVFGIFLGLFFLLIGLVFLGSAPPHTEFLRCERELSSVRCVTGQSLAGRWVMNERSVVLSRSCRADVAGEVDEGESRYRWLVHDRERTLSFGKTKTDRQEAPAIAGEVNAFLSSASGAPYQWRENVWWWFLSPFGLVGRGIGVFLIMVMNASDLWVFDHARGEVCHRRRFLVPVRRWPLKQVQAIDVVTQRDSVGDRSLNLRPTIRSGETIDMAALTEVGQPFSEAEGAAGAVRRFLGEGDERASRGQVFSP